MSDQINRQKSHRWASAGRANYDGAGWDSESENESDFEISARNYEPLNTSNKSDPHRNSNPIKNDQLPSLPKLNYNNNHADHTDAVDDDNETDDDNLAKDKLHTSKTPISEPPCNSLTNTNENIPRLKTTPTRNITGDLDDLMNEISKEMTPIVEQKSKFGSDIRDELVSNTNTTSNENFMSARSSQSPMRTRSTLNIVNNDQNSIIIESYKSNDNSSDDVSDQENDLTAQNLQVSQDGYFEAYMNNDKHSNWQDETNSYTSSFFSDDSESIELSNTNEVNNIVEEEQNTSMESKSYPVLETNVNAQPSRKTNKRIAPNEPIKTINKDEPTNEEEELDVLSYTASVNYEEEPVFNPSEDSDDDEDFKFKSKAIRESIIESSDDDDIMYYRNRPQPRTNEFVKLTTIESKTTDSDSDRTDIGPDNNDTQDEVDDRSFSQDYSSMQHSDNNKINNDHDSDDDSYIVNADSERVEAYNFNTSINQKPDIKDVSNQNKYSDVDSYNDSANDSTGDDDNSQEPLQVSKSGYFTKIVNEDSSRETFKYDQNKNSSNTLSIPETIADDDDTNSEIDSSDNKELKNVKSNITSTSQEEIADNNSSIVDMNRTLSASNESFETQNQYSEDSSINATDDDSNKSINEEESITRKEQEIHKDLEDNDEEKNNEKHDDNEEGEDEDISETKESEKKRNMKSRQSVNLGKWKPDTDSSRSGFLKESSNNIEPPPGFVVDENGELVDLTPSSLKPRVVSTYSEMESEWNVFPSNSTQDDLQTIADTKTLYDNSTIFNVPGLITHHNKLPPLPENIETTNLNVENNGSTMIPSTSVISKNISKDGSITGIQAPNIGSINKLSSNLKMNNIPTLDVHQLIATNKKTHNQKLQELRHYSEQLAQFDSGLETWISFELKSMGKNDKEFIFDEYKGSKHVKEAYANADELSKKHTVSNTVANVNQNVSHLRKKVFQGRMKPKTLFSSIGKGVKL